MIDSILERIIFSNRANKIIKSKGKRIVDYPTGEHRKILDLLQRNNIDLVLDVGANKGQYAHYLRSIGYKKSIVSFEPLDDAFEELQQNVAKGSLWTCHKLALGDKEEQIEINVANDSQSSSILGFSSNEVIEKSHIAIVKKQKIAVTTLDSIFEKTVSSYKNIYLKLDVQGYEMKVLEGAAKSLPFIKGIQMEMSLERMYEGEKLYFELIEYLKERQFFLCGFKNGFHDVSTGKLIQADGIFYKIDA